ncbi:MAG TPA: YkgJ family cysteine cluster protein [Povalibacter sp.]|uniref:YkgJ family cysteine cluster protein n=1 Tax=Povalibacter sp. TaxID=1962978 RepID=UPI002C67813A|nr:YkgJ family cysteine cluster protein [Povalibacter sp.]HMN46009.1 YkgJ family cysteine cluster protein [Povalibacter sp.]
MEISIDIAAVRRLIRTEYAQARADIAARGPVAALAASQLRHDARLASAADAGTLACKDGCAWCCHFTVDVRAAEVFRILDFVAAHFTHDQRERLRQEVFVNGAEVAPLSDMERMRRTAKCPFLEAGRCTIYAVRPQTCRNYHATDAAGCRQSYEQPDNMDIDPEFAPLVYQAGGAHVEAFSKAVQDAGYDTGAYELNMALAAALRQPESRARFEAGEAPFDDLAGDEVPAEFMDDD